MLPTKLTRAAQRATAAPPTATCYACLAAHRTHQRWHSSSKASSSADRYSNKPAGPATKATAPPAAEEEQPASAPPETPTPQRSAKGRARLSRRVPTVQDGNKKAIPAEPVDQFARLPSVPSVQSLSESERSLSNFFSLHRPMSIAHTFPPPSTPEDFSKIFTSAPPQQDPWANGNSAERRPEDVIYTINSTIENLENNANTAQDEGVRWEIVHESPSNSKGGGSHVHHLDGRGHPQHRFNLEELVAQFKPFRAPPPPQPFPESEDAKAKQQKEKKIASSRSTPSGAKPKQKTFTTTITVTESTYANGRKTYSASSGPIVAMPQPPQSTRQLTRRERMRRLRLDPSAQQAQAGIVTIRRPSRPVSAFRGERVQRKMFLISVKRQRKLKMKKHKYKKLMKRTRNLRRKLERN